MILKIMTARLGLRYSTSKTVELWVCQNTVLGRGSEPPARSARYLAQREPRLRALLHKKARNGGATNVPASVSSSEAKVLRFALPVCAAQHFGCASQN
jgi:hypothetical protein